MTDPTDSLAAFPRERTCFCRRCARRSTPSGGSPPDALDHIAAHLRVPKSEVWASRVTIPS